MMYSNRAAALRLQENGRWAIGLDELTSGDCVVLCQQARKGRAWLHGRIEHGKDGYYFLWIDVKSGPGMVLPLKEGQLAARE